MVSIGCVNSPPLRGRNTPTSTRHLAGNCTLVDTNSSTPTNEANSKQDDWLRITLRISVCVQISRHIKSLQRHRSPCQIVAGGMAANSN